MPWELYDALRMCSSGGPHAIGTLFSAPGIISGSVNGPELGFYISRFVYTNHLVVHDKQHLSLLVLAVGADKLLAIGYQPTLLWLQQEPLEVSSAVPRIARQVQLLEGAWQYQRSIQLDQLVPAQIQNLQRMHTLKGARRDVREIRPGNVNCLQ